MSCYWRPDPGIRFTHPEKLGPKEYSCSKCAKGSHVRQLSFSVCRSHSVLPQEATKRMSVRKLPPVLSFQFKVRPASPVPGSHADYSTPWCVALRTQVERQSNSSEDRHPGPIPCDAKYGTVHDARHERREQKRKRQRWGVRFVGSLPNERDPVG
jgi:hypothetical protein